MKLGLTLEGGASRTYFSVGVMDVLLREKIMADVVVGSSAGIANGVNYVSRQEGRCLELGMRYIADKRYMGLRHLLNPKNRSYYNISFVFDQLPNRYLPFDYDAYRRFPGQVVAAVTNIETAQTEYLPVTGDDPTWRTLLASCALPLLFPVIDLNGKKYMDGGISNPIPVDEAMRRGCNKNIVIITRELGYHKDKEQGAGLAGAMLHKYPAFRRLLLTRAERYNVSHRAVVKMAEEGKLFLIAPEDTIGWKRTDKEPERLKMMYDCGVARAEAALPALKRYLTEGESM